MHFISTINSVLTVSFKNILQFACCSTYRYCYTNQIEKTNKPISVFHYHFIEISHIYSTKYTTVKKTNMLHKIAVCNCCITFAIHGFVTLTNASLIIPTKYFCGLNPGFTIVRGCFEHCIVLFIFRSMAAENDRLIRFVVTMKLRAD